MAFDIYEMITNRIIDILEQGTIPWNRPWTGAGQLAIKRTTGKPYSLLNQLLLENPGEYITFKQCQKEGGKVKKGAKSKIVVFWKMLNKPVFNKEGQAIRDSEGNQTYNSIPYLQYSHVFHIEDCEGLEPKTYTAETLRDFDPIKKAEAIIDDYVQRSGIGFEHKHQGEAYYSPLDDNVVLPLKELFTNENAYYGTAFHELTHSTGHFTRLNRFQNTGIVFGKESYSKEELVAELGSATILKLLGIETDDTVRNNAAYIQNWINALRKDKRMIVSAASKAEKAVSLIMPDVA